jgi:hypothetical protein
LVSIIGGRFGSASNEIDGYSISQIELKRAVEQSIQVFIFVEKSTYHEYETYMLNRENDSVKYRYVDNKKIFTFLEEIYSLPQNNAIAPFETSDDITEYLRIQWAGLFQRLIQDQAQSQRFSGLAQIDSIVETLKDLVQVVAAESKDVTSVKEILFANHPAFRRFREITKTKSRVYFSSKNELDVWLKEREWKPVTESAFDAGSKYEWFNAGNDYIKVTERIFDSKGRLKPYSEDEWDDMWVQRLPLPYSEDEDDPNPSGDEDNEYGD